MEPFPSPLSYCRTHLELEQQDSTQQAENLTNVVTCARVSRLPIITIETEDEEEENIFDKVYHPAANQEYQNNPEMATAAASASASPPAPQSTEATQAHTRTYQACIPCRKRKVKCHLGPVDNPGDPPCSRCRRESKECYFSATRRKRKHDSSVEPGESAEPDDYEIRNGRKRNRQNSSEEVTPIALRRARTSSASQGSFRPPLTPGGHTGSNRPLRRPGSEPLHSSDDEDQASSSNAAVTLQQKEVFHQGHALEVLALAASTSGKASAVKRERSESFGGAGNTLTANTSSPVNAQRRTSDNTGTDGRLHPTSNPSMTSFRDAQEIRIATEKKEALRSAHKAWARTRFVRLGWFSTDEAIGIVEYFYKHLCPMTPITISNFEDPAKHASLLSEEPILATTILTIASRYHKLPGHSSASRGFIIHEELWKCLQKTLNRVIWAQETFRGGVSGGVAFNSRDWKHGAGLRTMGTIESLLLLTEWHCRSLHFPTGDDNNELVVTDDIDDQSLTESSDDVHGRKMNTWLAPSWRSERMCWSLLGIAMSLAFEIGIFDEKLDASTYSASQISRIENLRRLLFVYITQTSGRLSLRSMLPENSGVTLFSVDQLRRISLFYGDEKPDDNKAPKPTADDVHLVVMYIWCEIAQFMKDGNQEVFRTQEVIDELIDSGKYVEVLQRFRDRLEQLRDKFDNCKIIPEHMHHVLNIEFQYSRVFCNTLALSAVVKRCVKNTAPASDASATDKHAKRGPIPPELLWTWSQSDRVWLEEIVEGCHRVLECVVHKLAPQDSASDDLLKHAPVRTFFRIVSVSVILLKCFSAGSVREKAEHSLMLFNRASDALRTCVVDDVHVASRVGDMLKIVTENVRSNLVHVINNSRNSPSASRIASRAPTPPDTASADIRMQREYSGPNVNGTSFAAHAYRPPATTESTRQYQNHYDMTTPTLNQHHSPHSLYGRGTYRGPYPYSPNPELSSVPQMGKENHLQGIDQRDYNPSNPNMSIIVPPFFYQDPNNPFVANYTGGAQQNHDYSGQGSVENSNFDGEWVGLPLEPLLEINGADVLHTGFGPELGGQDMLDFYSQQFAS